MRRRFSTNNQNVNYMAIEALEDGLTVTISGKLSSNSKIEYSIDGVDWVNMEIDVATSPINCGEKLLFKGNYLGNGSAYIVFSISKKCNLKGDIKTLWYGDNAGRYKTALYAKLLFSDCTTIQHVDNYFLSAVDLTEYCYCDLFYGCTSLVNAPELPATTLARECYSGMFYGCTKLNYIKMLATDISADSCLRSWVYRVAATGTFIKNPAMTTLPTGSSGIPSGWTVLNDGEE